jgi:sugar/nucleoside kinase (ribokinase family)
VVAIDEDGEPFTVRPPRVRVRSAVGAGDAFAAALLASAGRPLRDRVALAVRVAAAHCAGRLRGEPT